MRDDLLLAISGHEQAKTAETGIMLHPSHLPFQLVCTSAAKLMQKS